jgi:hypothetical protein
MPITFSGSPFLGGRTVVATLFNTELATNTATLQDSVVLNIPLEVGTWSFETLAMLGSTNFSTAGTRNGLRFTGIATLSGASFHVDNSAASPSQFPITYNSTNTVDYTRIASGQVASVRRIGNIVVSTAGNLIVTFAQQTATVDTSTQLLTPSFIRATRIS